MVTEHAMTFSLESPIGNVDISKAHLSDAEDAARRLQLLACSAPLVFHTSVGGGTAVFNSTITIRFEYPETPGTDLSTLKIYRFKKPRMQEGEWLAGDITHQTVQKMPHGFIKAVGWGERTSSFTTFLAIKDKKPPITTLSLVGPSRHNSSQPTIVPPYTMVAALSSGGSWWANSSLPTIIPPYTLIRLRAVDPGKRGTSSGIKKINYSIDIVGVPNAPDLVLGGREQDYYMKYSEPIQLPPNPGATFVVKYFAEDYAGNRERVREFKVSIEGEPEALPVTFPRE
jgi:hypothetical protein